CAQRRRDRRETRKKGFLQSKTILVSGENLVQVFAPGLYISLGGERMDQTPTTRPSLLVRLHGPRDEQAWVEFTAIYAPLVERLARQKGLQDADAADLVQEVLRTVAAAIERQMFDPARGSFRGWRV